MANEQTVERFVESLRIAVERPIVVNGQAMSLTASMGSAMYPNDGKDSTKLMRVADQRMYFLKKRPVQPAQIAAGQA
jgi:GGDEF domain-containing protein